MTDWGAIETEYLTTTASCRQLAQKYGLSHSAVSQRAKAGDWALRRRRLAGQTQAKIIDALEQAAVGRAVRLQSVADKLLQQVEAIAEGPDRIGTSDLKNLSSVLKNLKDIQLLHADVREQEAKIRNLERQAQKEEQEPVRVILDPGLAEYCG